MKSALSIAVRVSIGLSFAVAAACGGGDDGGTPPMTVDTVVITSPTSAVTFQTLGRTVPFTAVAKDVLGNNIAATIAWISSNSGAASISQAGLVTAVGNGTTTITAVVGGHTSPGIGVAVAQVPATINGLPPAVNFGALGKTRQLTATVADSGGAAVAGIPAPTFTRNGPGTISTVSGSGLVSAVAVGTGDTAVATAGAIVVKVPITVTQVVNTVTVTSTSVTADTLRTATRTRQYSASARDSNNNVIASATVFAWTSSTPGVAAVGAATGLVTAGTTSGSTNIQASISGVNGTRAMVVNHYPATFTITPPSANIVAAGGTQVFTGVAQDSVNTNLTISWSSKATGIATVNPATGTTTTATAVGDGSTYIVISAGGTIPQGGRRDSSTFSASNQVTAPLTAAVTVGDIFFKSVHNNTQNSAIDTVAVGGQVTWTWTGPAATLPHTVASTGTPNFTSSNPAQTSGSVQRTFNVAGTYTYECAVHGSAMTGTIIVR